MNCLRLCIFVAIAAAQAKCLLGKVRVCTRQDPVHLRVLLSNAADDFKDLCGRLESLASQAGSTPVVTITSADTPEQPASYADAEAAVLTEDRNVSDVNAAQSSARAAAGDDWELV